MDTGQNNLRITKGAAWGIAFTVWTMLWVYLGIGVEQFWPFGCWAAGFIGAGLWQAVDNSE